MVLYRTRPPRDFISDYLTQMRGQYGAPPLRSIVRVPRIDDDGNIHFTSGYDPQTGLFHDKSPTFDVPPNPSRDAARKAAEVLLFPFSKYQFDDPAAGQALLLAAIFTAIERPFLPVAPMFVVRSSMPGTGKGKIVRSLVRLAFDTEPVAITWGGSSEEFEKRLAALLLQTPGVLSIDNANGMQIKGDLLESIITEGCADIRPLGHSKIVKVRNRSLVTLTGNNPIITGDMARRALPIDILPRSADPERDRYPFDPAEVTQRRRTDFLMAAFTAMRAFRLAGMPRQGLPAVGSFDDWSRKVRDLVYWLTGYDVSEAFRQNKAEDPRRQGDASLLAALHQHFGTNPFKAADPIAVHKRVTDQRRSSLTLPAPTPTEQALHEAIEDVLGSRDAKRKGLRLLGTSGQRGSHWRFHLGNAPQPRNERQRHYGPANAAGAAAGKSGKYGKYSALTRNGKMKMTVYSHPYPGRKRSRACRFPALAQNRMRAITSALPCRCKVSRIFAATVRRRYRPVTATAVEHPLSTAYTIPPCHHVPRINPLKSKWLNQISLRQINFENRCSLQEKNSVRNLTQEGIMSHDYSTEESHVERIDGVLLRDGIARIYQSRSAAGVPASFVPSAKAIVVAPGDDLLWFVGPMASLSAGVNQTAG